ncbi:MAG TPA: FAD/NAD(P)-binding protein [Bryobacteraceae bacterium]|jgi:spermidine dehydrogenase|nr:FAD/NAD(P)-binding protein [Bryobacteraceae bacterium]
MTRRDYLNSTLLASGSLLLGGATPMDLLAKDNWDGYGGVGDYASSNGNTFEVIADAHSMIRDHASEDLPANMIDTGEKFDCVVVGGGISGLAAALFFKRQAGPRRTCLVLENHRIFGGEARRNEFVVRGRRLVAHQGSAMFFPPLSGTFLADFYDSIGVDSRLFEYQTWTGREPEIPLGRTSYTQGGANSGFFFGARFGQPKGLWLIDPWGKKLAGAPIPDATRRELLAISGSKPVLPQRHGDELSRHLDGVTLEDHLMQTHRIRRQTVRTFLSPVSGGGSGLGADALSAYSEYAADVLLPWKYESGAQMFPGGNAGVARHIVKALVPDAFSGGVTLPDICRSPVNFAALDRPGQESRIRLHATAIAVQHGGEPQGSRSVRIVYAQDGKLYGIQARSAIMAGGSWTTKHIVKNLPETHRQAYAQFYRAPCLMANVAVRNWRFLYELGISECQWFEGIGNYFALRKMATFGPVAPTVSPDSPVVLTLKILFSSPGLPIGEQVTRGRSELLSTSFRAYEQRIREQFSAMFSGTGFDERRDIAGIILNRWGHAYLSPQPGFFFGKGANPAPGEVLRNTPFGRIAFANSDLAGIMDHRASILEARRAVGQTIDRS